MHHPRVENAPLSIGSVAASMIMAGEDGNNTAHRVKARQHRLIIPQHTVRRACARADGDMGKNNNPLPGAVRPRELCLEPVLDNRQASQG